MMMRFIVATATALSVLIAALPASAAPEPSPPDAGFVVGAFLLVFLGILLVFVFIPLVFHIWALVDISQGRAEEFGPPWDNSKQAWMLGLAIAFFVPFGHLVAPILWWTQVRAPRKRGQQAGRPFWMSAPPPGAYGAPGYGPPGYGPGTPPNAPPGPRL